jgi:hypothetical protein
MIDEKYNSNYGTRNERHSAKAFNGKQSLRVDQLTLDGEYIKTFPSLSEAMRTLGIKSTSNLVKVCKNERKYAYGYKWRYAR